MKKSDTNLLPNNGTLLSAFKHYFRIKTHTSHTLILLYSDTLHSVPCLILRLIHVWVQFLVKVWLCARHILVQLQVQLLFWWNSLHLSPTHCATPTSTSPSCASTTSGKKNHHMAWTKIIMRTHGTAGLIKQQHYSLFSWCILTLSSEMQTMCMLHEASKWLCAGSTMVWSPGTQGFFSSPSFCSRQHVLTYY